MRRVFLLFGVIASVMMRALYINLRLPFVPNQKRANFRSLHQQKGAGTVCRILGLRISVSGKLPSQGKMLLVCNHLGLYDSFVLASRLKVVLVAKDEMRNWPIAGWICRTVGIVFVARERRMKTGSFVEQVQFHLQAGRSVLIFPEGTTSDGRTVQPFKTGGFEAVAGRSGERVLPLYLSVLSVADRPADGAQRMKISWTDPEESMAANLWELLKLRRVHLQIRIGTPIATAALDRKELAQRAHKSVCALAAEESEPLTA